MMTTGSVLRDGHNQESVKLDQSLQEEVKLTSGRNSCERPSSRRKQVHHRHHYQRTLQVCRIASIPPKLILKVERIPGRTSESRQDISSVSWVRKSSLEVQAHLVTSVPVDERSRLSPNTSLVIRDHFVTRSQFHEFPPFLLLHYLLLQFG